MGIHPFFIVGPAVLRGLTSLSIPGVQLHSCDLCSWLRCGCVEVWEVMILEDSRRDTPSLSLFLAWLL